MSEHTIPGWLPGMEPMQLENAAGYFMVRSGVVQRTTLTEIQVSELVRSGRLTPYKVPANRKLTMFKVSDLEALFTPVPASEI